MNEKTSNQSEKPYSPPVDRLLKYGDLWRMPEPPDYLAGLSPEHIPELIRMATDEALNNAASDSLEVWAPLHAWRALESVKTIDTPCRSSTVWLVPRKLRVHSWQVINPSSHASRK